MSRLHHPASAAILSWGGVMLGTIANVEIRPLAEVPDPAAKNGKREAFPAYLGTETAATLTLTRP